MLPVHWSNTDCSLDTTLRPGTEAASRPTGALTRSSKYVIATTQPTTQNNLKQLLLGWYYNR